MNEAFENGHVDGTEQTAAHFKPLLASKDATIAALQEELNALQEEKLQLVGERDRSEESYKTLDSTTSSDSDSDDSEYNLGHMGPEGETESDSDSDE